MAEASEGGVRRLLAAMSVNVVGSILTAAAGVGATALMARRLPVDDFGRILLLLTAVNGFAIFEGLRPVVIHRVASGRESPHALFRATARINAAMAGVTLLCLALALFAGAGAGLPALAHLLLAATAVAFFVTMQYWTFLDAEQDTIFTGLSRTSGWTMLYVAFAGLAILRMPLLYYILALFLMHIGLIAALRSRFTDRGFGAKYTRAGHGEPIEPLLQSAVNNIVFNISAVTINVADRAIVGAVMGARSAGFYAGPSELALRAVGLVRAGVQVILPWAARLSSRDQDRYWALGALVSLVVVGSGCAVLLLIRDWVAVLLLGETFQITGDLLGLFAMGIVASTLGYVCIVQFNARGNFRTQRRLYIAAALLLVVGASAGAHAGKLIYVALAYLVARSVDLVLLALVLRRMPAFIRSGFAAIGIVLLAALVAGWNGWVWPVMTLIAIAFGLSWRFWKRVALP